MLGALIDRLDDPAVADELIAALDEPAIPARLAAAVRVHGLAPAELVAQTVRHFLDVATDDHWVQLIGIMNRAEDPGLAALRAILLKALPEVAA